MKDSARGSTLALGCFGSHARTCFLTQPMGKKVNNTACSERPTLDQM